MARGSQFQWGRLLVRLAPWLAVALYLAMTLPQLSLPGLHYDEAKEAGVNAMEMLQRQNVYAFRSAGLQMGTVFLPLMVQDYIGALNVYLALPFLALFGVTVPALRLVAVGCGLITLLLTWQLGHELSRWSGRPPGIAGALAALLLAASPSFIFWSRQGIFVTNVVVTLAVATVWMALRWRRTGRAGDLALAAGLAGLGLWAKLLFIWVLAALVAVGVIAWLVDNRLGAPSGDRHPPALRATAARQWLLAAVCFLAGLWPLLLFNQQTGGTFTAIFSNLDQSYYGVKNAAFLANLRVRLGQLITLLRSDHLWYLGGTFANRWAPLIAGGVVVAAFVQSLAAARSPGGRRAAAALLMSLLFVLLLVAQSTFTASDLFITHYAIVQPFVILLVGLAAEQLLSALAPGTQLQIAAAPERSRAQADGKGGRPAPWFLKIVAAIVIAALGVWLAADVATGVRYHRALAASGGYADHSAAVYGLAGWLDERDVAQPAAMDWGFEAPVRFLTGNRVRPIEVFGYASLAAPDAEFGLRVAPLLEDPGRRYLFHAPAFTVFQGRDAALASLAAAQGQMMTLEETIYDRSGQPMYLVMRARPE